ncbi:MAG TPA: ABC transporter permease [Cyclobacteriaceae bacterium]|nr:ABC transporter permease [Cyclobacteriaceae bacterium]
MKQGNPPRWAVAFFRWFCNDHLADAVLGDLLEMYDRRRATLGKFKADLLFILNVVQFIQPFAIQKRSTTPINTFGMVSNYFKVARRNMAKNKMYTAITIGGFSVGLATCMLIFLFIKNELSYDKHYKEGARIFRLYNHFEGPDEQKWANIQPAFAGVVKEEIPEVELAARLTQMRLRPSSLVRLEDNPENSFEEMLTFADPEILEIMETPMVFGDAKKALKDPQTVVLSRRKAIQYFGDTNPIGKVLIFNDEKSRPYTVGGVIEDFSTLSHFQYDFILSLTGMEFWPGEQTSWCCWNYTTYFRLREGANPKAVEEKMLSIRDTYLVGYMTEMGSQDVEETKLYHKYKLQPVKDIWLQSEIGDPLKHGSMTYVWLFGGIAIFILLLACINFINLSTARSANRAKEVGLRKVVGSLRKYLIAQFLAESTLYSLISFAIAIALVYAALPAFNHISGRTLTIPLTEWWLFPVIVLASLFIGILAGLYPSFYLSAFKPIDVIKGKLSRASRNSALRSGMVVFQFATSIMLIIGTFVVYQQMTFLMNREVGFDKDQLMIIEGASTLGASRESFRNELLQLPEVENVSISGFIPVAGMNREGYPFFKEGRSKIDKAVGGQKWRVDPSYISTMKMKVVDGRDFNRHLASDSHAIVINQTMARQLGLKEPVGQKITNDVETWEVIGVVEDFNYTNMKNPISPLSLIIERGGETAVSVRLKSSDIAGAIQSVNTVWNKFMPNQPIRFSFLDEKFARMYDDVLRMGQIFAIFATLAIMIACLGLFALSSFMIEQRRKEISIRLVLGAPVATIFKLLTGNFLKLVLVAFVIGAPLAWYGMNQWLQNFEYRAPVTSQIFMGAGLIAISIAIVTVSYQSIKAAMTKPVENLRET